MTKEQQNPWKTLKSEEVFNTPWISVTKHDVITPAGTTGLYGTVHFKGLAIGVLVLDEDYNTWIVGQYRYPINAYSWEIPEGGGDPKLPPIESAKRELLEETGIKANQWTELLHMHLSNSATDEYAIIFVAKDLSFHQANPDEEEDLIIKKIPFSDLYEMVMKSEITDSLTVAAALKAKILMDKGEL